MEVGGRVTLECKWKDVPVESYQTYQRCIVDFNQKVDMRYLVGRKSVT